MIDRLTKLAPQTLLNRAAVCGYVALVLPAVASALLFTLMGATVNELAMVMVIPVMVILLFTFFWMYRWHWGMGLVFGFVLFNIANGLMNIDPYMKAEGYTWMPVLFGGMFALVCFAGIAHVYAYHVAGKAELARRTPVLPNGVAGLEPPPAPQKAAAQKTATKQTKKVKKTK